MSGVPYIRFFSDDWVSGTLGLSLAEKGALITIVALTASSGQPPKADYERLRRMLGCTKKTAEKTVLSLVDLGKLKIEDGHIVNPRALKELKTSQKLSEKQKKSAEARWKNDPEKTNENKETPDATALPRQYQPEPEPELEVKDPIGSKKRKVKTAWPSDDWRPDQLSEKMKTKLDLTQKEYQHEFEKFRDGAEANNRKYIDWNAAWRTWLQSPYGTYGRRLDGKSGSKAIGASGSRNGQGSAGLGGAVERAAKRRLEQQTQDAGLIDITPRPSGSSSSVQTGFLTDDSGTG